MRVKLFGLLFLCLIGTGCNSCGGTKRHAVKKMVRGEYVRHADGHVVYGYPQTGNDGSVIWWYMCCFDSGPSQTTTINGTWTRGVAPEPEQVVEESDQTVAETDDGAPATSDLGYEVENQSVEPENAPSESESPSDSGSSGSDSGSSGDSGGGGDAGGGDGGGSE